MRRHLGPKKGYRQIKNIFHIITQVGEDDIESARQASDVFAKQDLAKGVRISITNKNGSRFVLLRKDEK